MMKKNKNLNNRPNQNEMEELENLFKLNDLDALEKKARKFIANYPKVSNLYNILGFVLQKKNNSNEAILNFSQAINIQPNFDQAHNNLGNVLQETGKFDEAIRSYQKAIKINPNYAEAYSNLGNALTELGKFDEAAKNQRQALKLNPNHAEFYTNLGSTLTELGKIEEAITNHQKAIKLNPQYAEAYSNLGIALAGLGKFEEAIVNHQHALKLNPKYTKAILNESFIRLTLGELKIGWAKYEMRLGKGGVTAIRYQTEKIWNGDFLDGTLLVWGEQGIGDHIIFASMLTDLRKYAKNIILEVDKRLENLLKRYFEKMNFSNIKILDAEKIRTHNFDKHIAIGSLGQYLRKSKKSFDATPKKYMIPSLLKEKELRNKFFQDNKLKIGISWKTLNKKQQFRNVNLDQMIPILSNPNCTFINLQFGRVDKDLQYLRSKHGINIQSIKEIDNHNDIDGLAALINCLDLVITIQNTTAHLSGALGKKTWIMLAKNARWQWFNSEKKSLWYPTAKLFRQEKMGDWSGVINSISTELKSLNELNKN